jgi:hypothetical protein
MFVWVGAGKLLDRIYKIYRIKKEQENEGRFGSIA